MRNVDGRAVLRAVVVLVAPLLAGLGGCSTVRLSREARRAIDSVGVSPEVTEEGSYSGAMPGVDPASRGSAWYSYWFTAPVGAVIDIISWSENAANRRRAFVSRIHSSGLHVGDIARQEFEAELAKARLFPRVIDEGGADARFLLTVEYGLDDGLGLRGTWKPWLELEGTLLGSGGEVLWRRSASISSRDERLPEFHEPFRRPDDLRRAYARAARILTGELLEHLRAG